MIPVWPALIFMGYSALVTYWWLSEWFKRVLAEYKVGRLQDEVNKLRKEE